MAYRTEKLEQQAMTEITERKLVYISELICFLPCDKTTFYAHKLNESNDIKEALEANRIDLKLKIRQKLLESDNPIALIASYKLFSNPDELQRLNSNSRQMHEHTQTKPFEFTLNLNPDNRISERLTASETKQITGEADYVDAEFDSDNFDN
jgi:hypothetical protein